MKQLKFSANGKTYIVSTGDAFMDNGTTVQFIPRQQLNDSVRPPQHEWQRLKPQLTAMSYEEFMGRKPVIGSITMYVYK